MKRIDNMDDKYFVETIKKCNMTDPLEILYDY